MLVDYVNRLRKEGAGALQALIEAGTVRFRPILLTSVTTFIGLVPILLEGSTDAQFLRPMVIALAFGVFFALFVTLLFVPALYAVGVDIARFYRGSVDRRKAAGGLVRATQRIRRSLISNLTVRCPVWTMMKASTAWS